MDRFNKVNPPPSLLVSASEAGAVKTERPVYKQLMLGFLGGAYVAIASAGSTMSSFNLLSDAGTYGLGRTVAGLFFGTALMLIILAGAELFTGNALNIISLMDKKITLSAMLKNWLYIYLSNFAGSLFIVLCVVCSGTLNSGAGLLGGITIKIAFGKAGLSFLPAFVMGILCNWLVCLAIWVSFAAHDVTGKIFAIFFVIGLFVLSGYEHCVANMYYVPAGILAKANALWASQSGLTAQQLQGLNWSSFALNNLLPVTLGNIVGGSFFVGAFYHFIYSEKGKK